MDAKAFATFAILYPHEAYATWPERFWEWFHGAHPTVTRAELEEMLGE